MISLAILAIALVALSDLNGGAVQMHAYARRATHATLLVQSKMLDLEELLQKEGFHDFDDEKHGTFEDEAPGYSWRAEILKPDVQLDETALLGMLGVGGKGGKSGSGTGSATDASQNGGLGSALAGAGALLGQLGGAGGGGAGGMAGLAGAGPFAGIIQGQAKTFIETLKKSVREVRVTVSWVDGKQERSISASQQVVILPEMVGKAGAQPAVQNVNPQNPNPIPGMPQGPNVKPPSSVSGDGSSR